MSKVINESNNEMMKDRRQVLENVGDSCETLKFLENLGNFEILIKSVLENL